MNQRQQIDSIRTRLWFSQISRRAEDSLITLTRQIEPQAESIGGTNKTILRWRDGKNLPQEWARVAMDSLLPGSRRLIEHALWDALGGRVKPIAGLDVVCPAPGGEPPLYRPSAWMRYGQHLSGDDQLQIANAEPPYPPAPDLDPMPQHPLEIREFLAWADYVLANLVWFDCCALGRSDDRALDALWNAREGIRAITAIDGFEAMGGELVAYLNAHQPLAWLLGLYCPEGEGQSGRYQEMWDAGWTIAG